MITNFMTYTQPPRAARKKRRIKNIVILEFILSAVVVIIIIFILSSLNNRVCSSLYVYQSSLTFLNISNMSGISATVVAVKQSDSSGEGPAYLLNGLSNKAHWYQVGLGYNWSKDGLAHNIGFSMVTHLEPNDNLITNSTPLSGVVHEGDKILLSMQFNQSHVQLKVYDLETGAYGRAQYPSFNGTYFVGGPYNDTANGYASDTAGHFTGLMTEWHHPNIYYKSEDLVVYNPNFTYGAAVFLVNDYGPTYPSNNIYCYFNFYNMIKPNLNQHNVSDTMKVNNSTTYKFSPFLNTSLRLTGMKFSTGK